MKYILRTTLVCLFYSAAFAAGSGDSSQFEVEKGILDSIYKGTVTEVVEAPAIAAGISVSPQISFVNISSLSLLNQYWEVPYGKQLGTVPGFSLHIANPALHWNGLTLSIKGAVGYSYKESVLAAVSRQTGRESRTPLTLHWLPLSLGTRLEYTFGSFQAVKPFLDLEGGAQWLYQTGKLDGIEQGFWVPFYRAAFGLTLFGRPPTSNQWFGGVNVGASVENSFASQQEVRTWSMDVGLNLYL